MKRKIFLENRDVPLLEQEKIKNIHMDIFERSNHINKKVFFSAFIAVICVFVVCLFVFFYGDQFIEGGDNESTDDYTYNVDTTDLYTTDIGVIFPMTDATDKVVDTDDAIKNEDIYMFDYTKVPEGHIPIVPKDISFYENGAAFITNLTGYILDTRGLLESKLNFGISLEDLSVKNTPKVLIIHTHGSESYCKDGEISYFDMDGEFLRTGDTSENVVFLGYYMAELLNKRGISALHCSIMHDGVQNKDSFSRSEATIKEYMKKYPSIKLVIDLHREAIINSDGEIVRPIALVNGEITAQVRCIIGSSWGGKIYPNWQNNLSLALKLREKLNGEHMNICRPPELRSSSYNQELSMYALTIEIGSFGNSMEEARRAVEYVSYALADIISEM